MLRNLIAIAFAYFLAASIHAQGTWICFPDEEPIKASPAIVMKSLILYVIENNGFKITLSHGGQVLFENKECIRTSNRTSIISLTCGSENILFDGDENKENAIQHIPGLGPENAEIYALQKMTCRKSHMTGNAISSY